MATFFRSTKRSQIKKFNGGVHWARFLPFPSTRFIKFVPEPDFFANLQNWWKLEDVNGDDFYGNHDLNLSGATLTQVNGQTNNAVQFSAQGYLERADTLGFSSYPYTVSCWAKTAGAGAAGDFNTFLCFTDASSPNYWDAFGLLNGNPTLMIRRSTVYNTSDVGISADDDVWRHYIMSMRSDTDKELFVNGVSSATEATAISWQATFDKFALGDMRDSTLFPTAYTKTLDEAMVFDIGLSAAQALELYNYMVGIKTL